MADQLGQADIRGEFVDKAVKGFSLMEFKMRQVCRVETSSSWKESYYQETAAELTATDTGGGFAVKGVARLAAFPNLEPSWTKVSSYHVKHAGESLVSWEDALASEIDVMARTLLRVGRAVAYSEDISIYDAITANASTNTGAASATWDNATISNRDPIGDILAGIQACAEDNYDILENGYMLMTPKNYRYLISNQKVLQHPTFKSGVMENGRMGSLLGLTIIVSNAVDADEVCLIKGQEAVTYKIADSLKTATIKDDGIKYRIRAWLISQVQIVNPEAIYIITNTEN